LLQKNDAVDGLLFTAFFICALAERKS